MIFIHNFVCVNFYGHVLDFSDCFNYFLEFYDLCRGTRGINDLHGVSAKDSDMPHHCT